MLGGGGLRGSGGQHRLQLARERRPVVLVELRARLPVRAEGRAAVLADPGELRRVLAAVLRPREELGLDGLHLGVRLVTTCFLNCISKCEGGADWPGSLLSSLQVQPS